MDITKHLLICGVGTTAFVASQSIEEQGSAFEAELIPAAVMAYEPMRGEPCVERHPAPLHLEPGHAGLHLDPRHVGPSPFNAIPGFAIPGLARPGVGYYG